MHERDKLQEALDKLQADALYDTLATGVDESKRTMLDLDIAVGKLTKEYGPLSETQRKQVQTIRAQTLESVMAKQAYEAEQKALQDALDRSEEMRQEFLRPFENAADDMQALFKDTFKDIFSGEMDSFSDLAQRIKDIFFELAAQIDGIHTLGLGQLNGVLPIARMAADIGNPDAEAESIINNAATRLGWATAKRAAMPPPIDCPRFLHAVSSLTGLSAVCRGPAHPLPCLVSLPFARLEPFPPTEHTQRVVRGAGHA